MPTMTEPNSSAFALDDVLSLSLDTDRPWLAEIRRAAAERFRAVGYPRPGGREWEHWRFTQLKPITETRFVPASPLDEIDIGPWRFDGDLAAEIVFLNGHHAPALSRTRPDLAKLGVRLRTLPDALRGDDPQLKAHLARHASVEKNPFVALNTAGFTDGVLLFIPRGLTLVGTIHLLFVSAAGDQPSVTYPRVLVVAEDNCEVQIVESYVGSTGRYFTNAVTEIHLGDDCRIDHCKLQQESMLAAHVATMQVRLGRATQFVSHSITTGGRVTRNDLNCVMAGESSYATLNGLVVIGGSQHVDNHTLLDHAAPNCPSHELYKHVLNDKATGVFKGQILVRQPAQKTDSKQNSKTLLLSDDAQMNSMPALEIYADDVKCTHGSTTGPVDEEQVFYLQSRGLSLDAARHLMTYAFAADVTRRIQCTPVRARIEDFMANQHGLPQDLRINDLGAFDEDVI